MGPRFEYCVPSRGTQRPAKLRCVICAISLSVAISFGQVGPPFLTDDPEPPPPGGWEINVPFIVERTSRDIEMDSPLLDFNYGLPDVQLKLEFPIKILYIDSDGTTAGAGDLLLGVKW